MSEFSKVSTAHSSQEIMDNFLAYGAVAGNGRQDDSAVISRILY
jgi:hypothetical protein